MSVTIICADARDALAERPEGSVHTCITSPPYWGLRDYGLEPVVWGDAGCEHEWGSWQENHDEREQPEHGKTRTTDRFYGEESRRFDGNHQKHSVGAFCRRCNAWRGSLGLEPTPELYVEHLVTVMREVRRVLRDDGTLWLNLGFQWDGRGNCIDTPHMVRDVLVADGWFFKAPIVWAKRNTMPESVRKRPTSAHEMLFLMAKHPETGYYYDQDAIREPLAETSIARISQPTFNQQTGGPKDYGHGTNPSRSARKALENLAASHKGSRFDTGKTAGHQLGRVSVAPRHDNPRGRNRRSVWEIATQPYAKAHFATFPEKLVEPCILAGTSERGCCPECGAPWERVVEKKFVPQPDVSSERGVKGAAGQKPDYGGRDGMPRGSNETFTTGWRSICDHEGEPVPCRVLDPFAGSGTVGLVAERLGRHSVLIDASEDYCRMARERTAQMGLMA